MTPTSSKGASSLSKKHAAPKTSFVVMIGARPEGWPEVEIEYARSELALRHHAGLETETRAPAEALAPFPRWRRGRPAEWQMLPWS